jgi:hypothetical protein
MPAVSLVDAVESLGSAAALVGAIVGPSGLQFVPGAKPSVPYLVSGSELPLAAVGEDGCVQTG